MLDKTLSSKFSSYHSLYFNSYSFHLTKYLRISKSWSNHWTLSLMSFSISYEIHFVMFSSTSIKKELFDHECLNESALLSADFNYTIKMTEWILQCVESLSSYVSFLTHLTTKKESQYCWLSFLDEWFDRW